MIAQMDCVEFLDGLPAGSVDLLFADPPFNVGKDYGHDIDDRRSDYFAWCAEWIGAGARALSEGGAFWQFNIPRNNVHIGKLMADAGLEFRHAVAVDWTASAPTSDRLLPRHQSLLYFTKGKPRTFTRPRIPIPACRHCGGDIKDYGGKRKTMHPDGIAVGDVWSDIFPVMHLKDKHREANQLPERLLERVLTISSGPGDLVVDPFVGSGTTAAVATRMGRRFVGADIGDVTAARDRLAEERITAFSASGSTHFGQFCAGLSAVTSPQASAEAEL